MVVGNLRVSPVHVRLDVALLAGVVVAVVALEPDAIVSVPAVSLERTLVPSDELAVLTLPPNPPVDGSIVSGQTRRALGLEIAQRAVEGHVLGVETSVGVEVVGQAGAGRYDDPLIGQDDPGLLQLLVDRVHVLRLQFVIGSCHDSNLLRWFIRSESLN